MTRVGIHEYSEYERIAQDWADDDVATTKFDQYDDHEISLVDDLTGVLATERDVDHVFAFDSNFRTLGFTAVPEDTREP